MKAKLNIDRIAKGLGAEPMGKVRSSGGFFGAMQVVSDIKARLRVPAGGGRPTDPEWTERRVLPLRRRTLERLEKITAKIRGSSGIKIEVMQLAALLVEKDVERPVGRKPRNFSDGRNGQADHLKHEESRGRFTEGCQ